MSCVYKCVYVYMHSTVPDSECSILTCECTCPVQSVSSEMSEKKAMLGSRVSFRLVTAG